MTPSRAPPQSRVAPASTASSTQPCSRDASASDDVSYHELKGAPHYLEGHRREAMELCAEWLRARYP